VQVEDRVQAVGVEILDVVLHGLLVPGGRERLGRALAAVRLAVEPEPAVLVQRHPDRVGVPGRDRGRIGIVLMPVVVAKAVDAGVLRARVIDAQQPDRLARAIDEVIALDRDRQRNGGRPARRLDEHQRDDRARDTCRGTDQPAHLT
jgi:hypothetical protein